MKRLQDILDESTELTEVIFYRLPGNVINNELYAVQRDLKEFADSMSNGNDFDPKRFNDIIKTLQGIKKEAKKFNSKEEVPLSYQYKR